MNTTELSTALTFAVAIFTIIGGIYGALKVINTYRKNQREAHMAKVQNRVEYLKEKMRTLEDATADFYATARDISMQGKHVKTIAAIQAALFSIGDSELDKIAERLNPEPSQQFFSGNRVAITNGIKHLARVIQEESTK